MRNWMLLAGLTLAASLGFGGSLKQEPMTYLSGNLVGVVPNSGGSLVYTTDEQVELRTGLATVVVPYANISKAKLGSIRERSSSEPLYKVWALHKRIFKEQLQKVTVDFKSPDGEERTMIVELDKYAANRFLAAVHVANNDADTGTHSQSASQQPATWWGDSAWKTKRNASQWPTSAAPSQPAAK